MELNADYHRIKQIMENLHFSSDRKFAEAIGVSPQNFYDLKSGKTKKVSQSVISKIIETYPQFNVHWVMSGEGDMLKSANIQTIQGNGNHNNTNGQSNDRYIAHLETEIGLLRKEKEDLWVLVRKLMKTEQI